MIAEQQEIVRRVEGLFALADQLEARLAKARGQVEVEFDTSSGLRPPSPRSRRRRESLPPKTPSDEPASAVLAHIQ